jgi:diketogulonate reductase-like aldo/keto reductase
MSTAATQNGYRHIDTASGHREYCELPFLAWCSAFPNIENEEEIGRAVRDFKVPREEIFISTKLRVDFICFGR